VLAQISTLLSVDFFDAYTAATLNATLIRHTGDRYRRLLLDVDALVSHDYAFLLGPWIEDARAWGANSHDCAAKWRRGGALHSGWETNCERFYEWNARVQITSWHPVPKGADVLPEGPVDYAAKHWSGLIRDFYHTRAHEIQKQALLGTD
jgi:alpha-N-acetylglucosaminidase